jgi:hypothetical protein
MARTSALSMGFVLDTAAFAAPYALSGTAGDSLSLGNDALAITSDTTPGEQE